MLTQELSYAFSGNTKTNVSLEGTVPWRKVAALLLPNLLLFVPGIGWGARIAIGVGSALFSFLFEDKQDKIRKAKAKLRKDLTAPSHEMLDKMHNQVIEIFNKEIWNKGYVEFWNSRRLTNGTAWKSSTRPASIPNCAPTTTR